MFIRVFRMTDDMQTSLIGETQVNPVRLMIMAESREAQARKLGRAWTAGAIPFFAQEMISAVQAQKPQEEIEAQAANAAMAAWLCDSIFDGIDAEAFAQSDIVFTLLLNGAVKYERTLAKTS